MRICFNHFSWSWETPKKKQII